jgi:sulfur-oxidizing protein SoxY
VANPDRRRLLGIVPLLGAVSGLGLLRAGAAGTAARSLGEEEGHAAPETVPLGHRASDPRILLQVPESVEDGFFVPVTVESRIPETREILILVEENPVPLAVRFSIPAGTDPYVATRIKMARSGVVQAAVKAGGKLYSSFVETKITVGGCS